MKVNDKTIFDFMLKADSNAKCYKDRQGYLKPEGSFRDKIFESEFHDPYLAHAPMETHTALAQLEGSKLTVWAATQSPFGLQDSLMRETGIFP